MVVHRTPFHSSKYVRMNVMQQPRVLGVHRSCTILFLYPPIKEVSFPYEGSLAPFMKSQKHASENSFKPYMSL